MVRRKLRCMPTCALAPTPISHVCNECCICNSHKSAHAYTHTYPNFKSEEHVVLLSTLMQYRQVQAVLCGPPRYLRDHVCVVNGCLNRFRGPRAAQQSRHRLFPLWTAAVAGVLPHADRHARQVQRADMPHRRPHGHQRLPLRQSQPARADHRAEPHEPLPAALQVRLLRHHEHLERLLRRVQPLHHLPRTRTGGPTDGASAVRYDGQHLHDEHVHEGQGLRRAHVQRDGRARDAEHAHQQAAILLGLRARRR